MDIEKQKIIIDLITDPIEGPIEGVDFFIDEEGYVNVATDNIVMSGIISRKINTSGVFKEKFVRIFQRGDYIMMDFDTLMDTESVFTRKLGPKKELFAEVKKDQSGMFCVYLNSKRQGKRYKKLASVKKALKKLDQDMKQIVAIEPEEPVDLEELED
jgi:hypothetical protein